MWIGNVFSVCVSVYLSVLMSVSVFVTVWPRTFEVVNLENSFFDFDVNLDKFIFCPKGTNTYRYTDTHRYTHTHNKLITCPHAQFKKGNLLLFGIAIVF